MNQKMEVGNPAPDFTLLCQNGEPVHLADRFGKKSIVLFFYPKDSSLGCTMEACAFRDSYEDFTDAGAEVIGVSGGTTEDKQVFAQRNRLPYLLVSDPKWEVARLYGVEKPLGLLPDRKTFVIDRSGAVRHIFSSRLNMARHMEEALQIVKQLEAKAVQS